MLDIERQVQPETGRARLCLHAFKTFADQLLNLGTMIQGYRKQFGVSPGSAALANDQRIGRSAAAMATPDQPDRNITGPQPLRVLTFSQVNRSARSIIWVVGLAGRTD